MEKSLALRYNAGSTGSIATAVKIYFSLSEEKSHFSDGNVLGSVHQVRISNTVKGKQQAEINPDDVGYNNTQSIENLFQRIKFKPG